MNIKFKKDVYTDLLSVAQSKNTTIPALVVSIVSCYLENEIQLGENNNEREKVREVISRCDEHERAK